MSEQDKFSDSAGVPWEGRSFEENPYRDDDGKADRTLISALENFQTGVSSAAKVIEAFANARLLVPLLANLGEEGVGPHGQKVDKSAELSIVTVRTPDGQTALPVFSSVETLAKWNPQARPVPNDGRKVALAAAGEGNTRIVLDPTSQTEFVIRRPAIAAIAQELPWTSPASSPEVENILQSILSGISGVDSFSLTEGDPSHRLSDQELVISVFIDSPASSEVIHEVQAQLFSALENSIRFVELVDSVAVGFLPS